MVMKISEVVIVYTGQYNTAFKHLDVGRARRRTSFLAKEQNTKKLPKLYFLFYDFVDFPLSKFSTNKEKFCNFQNYLNASSIKSVENSCL
jgi:hypothetical protein